MAIEYPERYELCLQDELQPKIGSGFRTLDVKIGRKWVYLKTIHKTPELVFKKKIPIRVWKQLSKHKTTRKIK
jgi:hypothetical protein